MKKFARSLKFWILLYLISPTLHVFQVHHIKIQDVITEAISNLKITAARADDEEDDPDDDSRAQDSAKLLEDVEESKEKNNGRIDDELVIKFYKTKLNSVSYSLWWDSRFL